MTSLRDLVPLVIVALCFVGLFSLQRSIDESKDAPTIDDEYLYLSDGENSRRLALGYHALLADLYWLRAVQYFGGKVTENPKVLNTRGDKLKLLYPLIDITTDLDPHFEAPYRFGSYFVHDYVDRELGLKLLEKAIRNNPDNWHFYQDMAFLVWTDGDCVRAAEIYDEATKLSTAPIWLASMGPTVRAECGDLDTARNIYERLLDELGGDEYMGPFLRRKLGGLDAQEEVEALRAGIASYQAATGTSPPTLVHLLKSGHVPPGTRLRIDENGRPADPLGVPYTYDPATGRVAPDANGVILPVRIFKRKPPLAQPLGAPAGG